MRKWIYLAGATLAALCLLQLAPPSVREEARSLAARLSLPFRIARLYAAAPDRELAMPVDGVRVGGISNTWGAARSGGRSHEGQDIFAKRGTEVRSATAGYVARVGEDDLGGNVVFVAGSGGRRYYYAHLDRHADGLQAGDEVTIDTIIGYVGTTGNAAGTPPHLHFGVYTNDSAVDPLPLLIDREQSSQTPSSARAANVAPRAKVGETDSSSRRSGGR